MDRKLLGALALVVVTTGVCRAGGQSGAVVLLQSDSAHPIELSATPVRVALNPPGRTAAAGEWSRILSALGPERRLVLVLGDLRMDEPPGTLINVYLNLPEGVTPRPDDTHRIGSMNYFSVVQPRNAPAPGPSPSHERRFDITDLVRGLVESRSMTGAPSVTLVASRPPAEGSRAAVGRIEVVEHE
jgi:hypothetical protein